MHDPENVQSFFVVLWEFGRGQEGQFLVVAGVADDLLGENILKALKIFHYEGNALEDSVQSAVVDVESVKRRKPSPFPYICCLTNCRTMQKIRFGVMVLH